MASMDLDNFRESARDNLGLDSVTASSIDQSFVDRWVNEGVEEILRRTRCDQDLGTLTMTSGQFEAALTPDTGSGAVTPLDVLHITSRGTGTNRLLEAIGLDEILKLRTTTPNESSPIRFYSTMGYDRIIVYPTPSTNEILDVLLVPPATALTAGSDVPSQVPVQFHATIENYVLWKGAIYDDDSTSGFGQQFQIEFERGIMRLRRSIVTRAARGLSDAVVGNRWKTRVPHDNSQDV